MKGDQLTSPDFAELVATFISHIKVNHLYIIELDLFLYHNQFRSPQEFQIFPCIFMTGWHEMKFVES